MKAVKHVKKIYFNYITSFLLYVEELFIKKFFFVTFSLFVFYLHQKQTDK